MEVECFQRVIVIYLEHPTVINVDESAVAWSERGLIARNLTAEFEQSGYEDMYEKDEEDVIAVNEEDEGDEGIVPKPIHVDEEGDEGTVLDGINVDDETIYEERENDKRAENESEDSEDSEDNENNEDPEFYDSAYEQSEDEQCLLDKDDRAFDNYVDHNAPDIDPTAAKGEKSDDMAISDVNSLDSSSCDEVELPMRKRKRKLPKFEDFRLEIDLNNPIFKLGLRFPNVYVFRKAVRNYSVFNRRKIKFSKNDKDKVRAVCDGIKNGKYPWFVYTSAVNGSSMVQIKSYEEEHTCGTIERNVHTNSSWLAKRYAIQLSRIINSDVGAIKERVNEDLCVIDSRSQIYRARQKAIAVSERTYAKQFETLWDYVEELKRTNVGTIVKIKSNFEATNKSYQRLEKGLIITKHLLSLTKLLNHLTNQLNHLKLLLSLTKPLNHLTKQLNHLNHLTNQLKHLKHLSLNNHFKHLNLNKPLKLLSLNKHLKLLSLNKHLKLLSLNKPLKLLCLNKPLKLLCLNKPPNLKNQIRLILYKLPHKEKLGLSLQLRGKPSWQSLSHGDIENLSSVFAVSWGTHMFLGRNCLFRI
ncbi:unnamed protein product [Prunus armeniaca]